MSSPFVYGQRPEQHAMDDAEDRGVGADAERHRQDDGRGEAAIPDQPSERRAQVLASRCPFVPLWLSSRL